MKITEYEKDKINNDRMALIQDLGLLGLPILIIISIFRRIRIKKRR